MGNNTLGFGSLASVAWTDMNGTGLVQPQLGAVKDRITEAERIANLLLGAIKGAVNLDVTAFNLAAVDPAKATADAAFILQATGTEVPAGQTRSLSEWRRIAADLQDYAALEASKLPGTGGGGGGIKNVNGHWYVNGQQVSLLDVYLAVRVNQVSNFDDSLNIYIQELNANNKLVKAANAWLNTLRNKKPTNTTQLVALDDATRTQFSNTWGFDPVARFMPAATEVGNTTSKNYLKWDIWIDEVKSYVDGRDTENQTVQQKLEQMTNRRSEVLEGLTSFSKSQSQTGQSFARNLG